MEVYPGDKVHLTRAADCSIRHHQAIWTVFKVDDNYALLSHPEFGQWCYPMDCLECNPYKRAI